MNTEQDNTHKIKQDQLAHKAKRREYNLKHWWQHILGGIGFSLVGSIFSAFFQGALVQLFAGGLFPLIGLVLVIIGIINGIRYQSFKKKK